MHPRKIIHQNSLNMIIPSGIRILHPYNLHIVCLTDGIFLPVALLHHRIFKMLFPVKFRASRFVTAAEPRKHWKMLFASRWMFASGH